MIGQDARVGHAGEPGLFQQGLLLRRDPQAFHVRQEVLPALHLQAEHAQGVLAFARQHHALFQMPARHGDLVDLEFIGQARQGRRDAQIDAGKGHAKVEIQRTAQGGKLVVEAVIIQGRGQAFRDVQDDGDRGREIVLGTGGAPLAFLAGGGLEGLAEFLAGVPGRGGGADPVQDVAEAGDGEGQGKKLRLGETGDEREQEDQPARHEQGLGLGKELAADLRAHIFLAVAGTGDEDAGRDGDDERGYLGDETVADGQDAVDLQGLAGGNAVLGDADDGTAHDVDHSHDHAGDAVALDELHGAVHGAEHLAFLADDLAAALGFFHVDDAGAHVRVDGHLFAGHGIQGEARAHLGHTFGPLGDDQELDDGQDQEDHGPHHEIAAQGELAEGLDDLAGVGVEQDQAGGGDVQAHAEQGGEQQHGGEGRELQRRPDIHGHHHDGEGQGQVGADERVHQGRGQGHDHQGDDGHQQAHQGKVAVFRRQGDDVACVGEQAHRRPPPAAR